MKGPFERLKYDLRRLWECPQCKRRERSDGTVTTRFCSCVAKGADGLRTAMKLVEEAGHRTMPEFKYSLPAVGEPSPATFPSDILPAAVPPPESPPPPETPPQPESAAGDELVPTPSGFPSAGRSP